MKVLRPCLTVTGALLVLCCGLYPAVVTASASALFPHRAKGSLIVQGDKVVGSEILGQSVSDWSAHPELLWGRPSGASEDSSTKFTYSSGSNYGPLNATLSDEVKARIELLRASGVKGPIPIDLVTKSASGLDPHLSPEAAAIQVPRIAATRKMSDDEVRRIIAAHTESSTFGFLGEPRVNVLMVNLDLDRKAPFTAPPKPATSAASAEPAAVPQ